MKILLLYLVTFTSLQSWADHHQDFEECKKKAFENHMAAKKACENPSVSDDENEVKPTSACSYDAGYTYINDMDTCKELFEDISFTAEEDKN